MKTIKTMFTPLLKENSMKHIDYKTFNSIQVFQYDQLKYLLSKQWLVTNHNYHWVISLCFPTRQLLTRPLRRVTTICSARSQTRWVLVPDLLSTRWILVFSCVLSCMYCHNNNQYCWELLCSTTADCTIMQWCQQCYRASWTAVNHQPGSTKSVMILSSVLKTPWPSCMIENRRWIIFTAVLIIPPTFIFVHTQRVSDTILS